MADLWAILEMLIRVLVVTVTLSVVEVGRENNQSFDWAAKMRSFSAHGRLSTRGNFICSFAMQMHIPDARMKG